MTSIFLSYTRGDDVDPFDWPCPSLPDNTGTSRPGVPRFGLTASQCRRER